MKRVFCLPGLFYPVLHFVHLCRCVYVSIHHSSASEIPQVLISSVLFCFCFFNLDICLAKTLSFQLCLKKKLGCFYNTSFSLSFFFAARRGSCVLFLHWCFYSFVYTTFCQSQLGRWGQEMSYSLFESTRHISSVTF